MAGIGQMNHSDAGPSHSTIALPTIPSASPNVQQDQQKRNQRYAVTEERQSEEDGREHEHHAEADRAGQQTRCDQPRHVLADRERR